jgi:YggT family protein
MLIIRLIDLYSLVVLVAVVASWVQLSPRHPVARVVGALTDPVLRPIRQILPPFGGLDFSPMVLLFGLQLLKGLFV